jgi:hypothetical protein
MFNKMTKCKACGAEIAKSASRCPKCGAKQHQIALTFCCLIVVFSIFAIVASFSNILNASSGASSTSTASANQKDDSENKVIVDADGIKITYTGVKLTQYIPDQSDGYMLTAGLTIENSSGYDITVFPTDSSVNGVMKTAVAGMPLNALSGKKAVTGFSFTNLTDTGIDSVDASDKVKEIKFKLSIVNSGDSSAIYKSEEITINPNQ